MKKMLLTKEKILGTFLLLIFFISIPAAANNNHTKGNKMDKQIQYLPFGLKLEDYPGILISYSFHSAKTGMGKQEISISGDGKVKLSYAENYKAQPEIHEGKISVEVLIRLLDLFEEEHFYALEDMYTGDEHASTVIIEAKIGADSKKILVTGSDIPAFERIAGGIKLAAGLALPIALQHRFFPNL